jgi:poly-gamma-glutamate synthesis protein (capsule biosynthesis protein)
VQPVERLGRALVMYSIGCFHGPLPWLSTWHHRLSWMAELHVAGAPGGSARISGYRLHPLVLVREPAGHLLVPLDRAPDSDRRRMQRIIHTVFGSNVGTART